MPHFKSRFPKALHLYTYSVRWPSDRSADRGCCCSEQTLCGCWSCIVKLCVPTVDRSIANRRCRELSKLCQKRLKCFLFQSQIMVMLFTEVLLLQPSNPSIWSTILLLGLLQVVIPILTVVYYLINLVGTHLMRVSKITGIYLSTKRF